MEHQPLKLKIIVGSVREGRFAGKAAAWIETETKKESGFSVEVLDLKDYPLPFFDQAESPSAKKAPYTHPDVARFTQKIAEADAFIMVAPEYNHGPAAVLKNALDWVGSEWANKPVGFLSYGTVGGARSVEQLRLNAVELQMAPIREAIHINGEKYFPVLFGQGSAEELLGAYSNKAEALVKQLLWWSQALKNARS